METTSFLKDVCTVLHRSPRTGHAQVNPESLTQFSEAGRNCRKCIHTLHLIQKQLIESLIQSSTLEQKGLGLKRGNHLIAILQCFTH